MGLRLSACINADASHVLTQFTRLRSEAAFLEKLPRVRRLVPRDGNQRAGVRAHGL